MNPVATRRTLALLLATLALDLMAEAVRVGIRQEGGKQMLSRDGESYFIKGAVYGGEPKGRFPLSELRACGANSVRAGGRNLEALLDEAHRLGMTVTVNLPMAMEWADKFDYDNQAAVAAQFGRIQTNVLRYKDHPAVLMWSLGNELSTFYTNRNVWKAVNEAAEWIHQVDPNHPVLTVLGDSPGFGPTLREVQRACPALDLVGFNVYAGIEKLRNIVREADWEKPYVYMEWGPSGHWQVPKTKWRAPIEETSSEKAAVYERRYKEAILSDPDRCLGSYAFYWNWKQEITFTWYGLFLPTGERTEPIERLQQVWSGSWPTNRAPRIEKPVVDGVMASASVTMDGASIHEASVRAYDPDQDELSFEWLVLPEVTGGGYAGRGERKPEPLAGRVQGTGGEVKFTAPEQPGAYRIFVIVRDGYGNAATGNVPFLVR